MTDVLPNVTGEAGPKETLPVVIVLPDGSIVGPGNALPMSGVGGEYETVAAAVTDQVLGATTGAIGDFLSHLVITPAVAAAGAVSIKDGAGSAIPIYAGGGTTPLPSLAPFTAYLGLRSVAGGWKVTTGANVSVIAAGDFT